ncbi:unnamed protein product [Pelagomonas calceolata]|uniref:Uncharacterized protein n=1 Tax=Pelagomonas calceolata TaxID=35677 RepID=A0A8J2WYJ9_9STRA|nr:unnamed protein product [Pelagomonas calceolata]
MSTAVARGPAARHRPSAAPVNSTHTCAPSVGERSPLGKEIGPVVVVVVVEVLVEGVDGRRLGLQENLELGQRVEVDVGEELPHVGEPELVEVADDEVGDAELVGRVRADDADGAHLGLVGRDEVVDRVGEDDDAAGLAAELHGGVEERLLRAVAVVFGAHDAPVEVVRQVEPAQAGVEQLPREARHRAARHVAASQVAEPRFDARARRRLELVAQLGDELAVPFGGRARGAPVARPPKDRVDGDLGPHARPEHVVDVARRRRRVVELGGDGRPRVHERRQHLDVGDDALEAKNGAERALGAPLVEPLLQVVRLEEVLDLVDRKLRRRLEGGDASTPPRRLVRLSVVVVVVRGGAAGCSGWRAVAAPRRGPRREHDGQDRRDAHSCIGSSPRPVQVCCSISTFCQGPRPVLSSRDA